VSFKIWQHVFALKVRFRGLEKDKQISLDKVRLGVDIINILLAHFSYKSAFLPKSFRQSQKVTREKLPKILSYKKGRLKR